MTVTCGGTMSGNCATGICERQRARDRNDERDDDPRPGTIDEDGAQASANRGQTPVVLSSFACGRLPPETLLVT